MIRILCLCLGLFASVVAFAQNSFRSRQTGDWNQSSTWEEFIAGSWQLTASTPTSGSGAIFIQNTHVVTVTASVTIDEATVQQGGRITVNNAVIVTLNNGPATDLTNSGRITMLGESFIDGLGSLTIDGNGTIELGSLNTTGALSTGTTVGNVRISGPRTYLTGSHFTYNGTGAQIIGSGHPGNSSPTGITTEVDNAAGLSFDTNAGSNFTGGGTLYLPGDLTLTQGNLNIVSSAGVTRTLVLLGNITANAHFITLAGPAVNITLSGSGDITFPSPAGLQTVGNLTITRPGNTINFPSEFSVFTRLTVSGNVVFNGTGNVVRDIVLSTGSIDFNGSASVTGSMNLANSTTLAFDGTSLSMAGDFVSTGGVLASNPTSSLTMTGAFPLTSFLVFAPGSQLSSFTLNKVNAGTSATINSPLNIATTLTLTSGILEIVSSNLSLSAGATLNKASLGSISNTRPGGGAYHLVYTGTSQATGFEIPASGILASLTVNTNSSTQVTLSQNITVNGIFSIPGNGRTFTSGAFNVAAGSLSNFGVFDAPTNLASTGLTVAGNFANSGTFNHNSGTVNISGPSVFSGATINTTNFNTISIAGAGALTAPATLNIAGDFINAGGFTSGAGMVVFNGGTSTLSGATMSATSFANVQVNPGATLVPAANFILTGNLTMNGLFTRGSGTTTFNGVTNLTGTTINTTLFNAIQINATRSLIATNITVGITGNFTNDGTFSPGTSGTLLCAGASTLGGGAITTTNFIHIQINNLSSASAPANLNVEGNFTNNGTFTANTGTVSFTGGTGGRTLGGTTNTPFYNITLNKTNGGTSVSVSNPQTVTHRLTLTDGILDNPGGNLQVSSGASVFKSSNAAVATAALTGGPYSVTYLNATQPTGLELPASGIVSSLTVDLDAASTLNLSQALTVQAGLIILNAGRTFTSGANNVSIGSLSNAGTFNAPTAAAVGGLTVLGNISNNGTFNHNTGLVSINAPSILSGSGSTSFNRLTIGSTFTANSNFNVASHFTNNGTYNGSLITVVFNGSTLQNIGGTAPLTTFRNMTISNAVSPTGVSIESNVNLIGILTLGASVKLDPDGSANNRVLTLLSTNDSPAADASIANLPATAQINGNITVQRFFRPADNFDRFISAPISNASIAMFQAANVFITGEFTGTSFPCTGCVNNGDNLRYNKESLPGTVNVGYVQWATVSNAQTLVPGVGYDLYMWNGVANTTLNLRGTINRGSIPLGIVPGTPPPAMPPPLNTITHTNNGLPSADGWNLVGNPYPSAIQWNNGAGWTKTNIDPTVWVWDVVGRVWHSFNANTSLGDLTNGVIASGQGFWVYAPVVGAASLTINEAAKSVAGSGSYFRERDEMVAIRVSLGNHSVTDNSFVVLGNEASKEHLRSIEAVKPLLGIEQVSVYLVDAEQRNLGHYASPGSLKGSLPIKIQVEENGEYQFSFEDMNGFPGFESYYLIDAYLGESTRIASGKPYSFSVDDSKETRNDRFFLSSTPLEKDATILPSFSYYPNPVSGNLTVEISSEVVERVQLIDQTGKTVRMVQAEWNGKRSVARMDLSDQPNGLYILKVVSEGKQIVKKILVFN